MIVSMPSLDLSMTDKLSAGRKAHGNAYPRKFVVKLAQHVRYIGFRRPDGVAWLRSTVRALGNPCARQCSGKIAVLRRRRRQVWGLVA